MSGANDDAIAAACSRIAPTWPLDRFIAVNPFWGLIDRPLAEVASTLGALSGAQLLMPRAFFNHAYREGLLRDEHLESALEASGSSVSLASLRALLEQPDPAPSTRAQVVDVVDATRDLIHEISWRTLITNSVSQFCAAFFDDGQAQLGPDRRGGLYASWRRHAAIDRSIALLMGDDAKGLRPAELPSTPRALIEAALLALDVSPQHHERYLWSLLLEQNGWASWCAYLEWIARLEGRDDETIRELLAIRLAWEWMLLAAGGEALSRRWVTAMAGWPHVDTAAATSRATDWLFQTALEIAWREPIIRMLPTALGTTRGDVPAVQAVFCIDVRSEVFRRALERSTPSVHTLGFAGFFGLPMEYQPLGTPSARPQLPGLLAPRVRATDTGVREAGTNRSQRLGNAATWSAFKTDPFSTFTFVEALGLTSAGALIRDSLGLGTARSADSAGLDRPEFAGRKPRLVEAPAGGGVGLEARIELAAGMLRGMSLTRHFARLILLAGHGSGSRNNPHAAGLDCGACCGQTGEINARVAAALLNDAEVRRGLGLHGIVIPETTRFVPALHNTTTDEVELFELDEVPGSHRPDIDSLNTWLAQAGARARVERAANLGLRVDDQSKLERSLRARTTDWAQVRPEWGLANNAAFIVAPREHCRHLDLKGRSFLHEYRHQEDEGFQVLEQIMTAPMVVTHWINFQYYASTVDNVRYGSGNKVLHNVVGGHLGVFEGNGGDLRIGLPMQSLHDGARWVHTPLRLSVFIEAPRAAITNVLEKHAHVRALVTNGWLSLFQIDDEARALFPLSGAHWEPVR